MASEIVVAMDNKPRQRDWDLIIAFKESSSCRQSPDLWSRGTRENSPQWAIYVHVTWVTCSDQEVQCSKFVCVYATLHHLMLTELNGSFWNNDNHKIKCHFLESEY